MNFFIAFFLKSDKAEYRTSPYDESLEFAFILTMTPSITPPPRWTVKVAYLVFDLETHIQYRWTIESDRSGNRKGSFQMEKLTLTFFKKKIAADAHLFIDLQDNA